ncbi:MAG: biotin--[acetyl-CoA-carboxylase] ligase [Flavobacteriaceae bacterium]|nr:biotin--[acetyl-CoA-carboxylase] ligase [Flavobacteriaceae bacterium]
MKIIKCHTTSSTNDDLREYALENHSEETVALLAFHQKNGKGQRGRFWHAEENKSLTFSMLYKSIEIPFAQIFQIHVCVTIALIDFLNEITKQEINFYVKWPNDIMAENKKCAGILIETKSSERTVIEMIIGVGVNLNNTEFPNQLKHAVSLKQISGEQYSIEDSFNSLIERIEKKIGTIPMRDNWNGLFEKYQQSLFKRKQQIKVTYKNKALEVELQGVDESGRLVLKDRELGIIHASYEELKWNYDISR